jgi:hypothetical protein
MAAVSKTRSLFKVPEFLSASNDPLKVFGEARKGELQMSSGAGTIPKKSKKEEARVHGVEVNNVRLRLEGR